jgi:hypothetical protein
LILNGVRARSKRTAVALTAQHGASEEKALVSWAQDHLVRAPQIHPPIGRAWAELSRVNS